MIAIGHVNGNISIGLHCAFMEYRIGVAGGDHGLWNSDYGVTLPPCGGRQAAPRPSCGPRCHHAAAQPWRHREKVTYGLGVGLDVGGGRSCRGAEGHEPRMRSTCRFQKGRRKRWAGSRWRGGYTCLHNLCDCAHVFGAEPEGQEQSGRCGCGSFLRLCSNVHFASRRGGDRSPNAVGRRWRSGTHIGDRLCESTNPTRDIGRTGGMRCGTFAIIKVSMSNARRPDDGWRWEVRETEGIWGSGGETISYQVAQGTSRQHALATTTRVSSRNHSTNSPNSHCLPRDRTHLVHVVCVDCPTIVLAGLSTGRPGRKLDGDGDSFTKLRHQPSSSTGAPRRRAGSRRRGGRMRRAGEDRQPRCEEDYRLDDSGVGNGRQGGVVVGHDRNPDPTTFSPHLLSAVLRPDLPPHSTHLGGTQQDGIGITVGFGVGAECTDPFYGLSSGPIAVDHYFSYVADIGTALAGNPMLGQLTFQHFGTARGARMWTSIKLPCDKPRARGKAKPILRVGEATNLGPSHGGWRTLDAVGGARYRDPEAIGFWQPRSPGHGAIDIEGDNWHALRIATANTTSWSSLQKFLLTTDVDVVLAQEHHLPPYKVPEASDWARRNNWHAMIVPAASTEAGGWSGGVAVIARPHAALSSPRIGSETIAEARIVAASVELPGIGPPW